MTTTQACLKELLICEWTNATGVVTPAKAGVQEHREEAWIPAPLKNTSSSGLIGLGRNDFVSQGFEHFAMVTHNTPGVELLEVVGAEILVRLPGIQQVIDHPQLRMGYGEDGASLASSARQSMELSAEIGVFHPGRRPARLA